MITVYDHWFHSNILIWQGVAANRLNDGIENNDFVKRLGKAFDSLTVRSEESGFKSQHKSYPAKCIGDRIRTQHCSSAAVAALNRQCFWYHKNLSVSAQRLQQGEKNTSLGLNQSTKEMLFSYGHSLCWFFEGGLIRPIRFFVHFWHKCSKWWTGLESWTSGVRTKRSTYPVTCYIIIIFWNLALTSMFDHMARIIIISHFLWARDSFQHDRAKLYNCHPS